MVKWKKMKEHTHKRMFTDPPFEDGKIVNKWEWINSGGCFGFRSPWGNADWQKEVRHTITGM